MLGALVDVSEAGMSELPLGTTSSLADEVNDAEAEDTVGVTGERLSIGFLVVEVERELPADGDEFGVEVFAVAGRPFGDLPFGVAEDAGDEGVHVFDVVELEGCAGDTGTVCRSADAI